VLPRVLVVTLVALVVGGGLLIRFAYQTPSAGTEVTLGEIYQAGDEGRVLWARLLDENAQIVGQSCAAPLAGPRPEVAPSELESADAARAFGALCPGGLLSFRASYPRSDVATQKLIDAVSKEGADVVVDKQLAKAVAKLMLLSVLPLLLLVNLFALIFLSKSGGGDDTLSGVIEFGEMGKRERQKGTDKPVSFADVAGSEDAVIELREVTDYLRDPQRFEAYGAAVPKGVLLFGPPGCGKTLLARATAGDTGVAFFSVAGTEFVEALVGVGAARVRDLFRQVREAAPAIVFIDEIDAVGRRRSGEGSSGGEREQTLNQLLVEMDGFEPTAGIVLMGATNRPDILDPALMRPGRFDRHVTLQPPDVNGRRAILALHAKNKPMAADVDLEQIARRTPGFTGADLANIINEGALLAIREGSGGQIHASHLSEAVQRVLQGPQRRGQLMSAGERKRVAYHEAGHAIVAAALGRNKSVHRISIVARGRALGQTTFSSEEGDRVLLTRSDMEDQVTTAMAGVAAEQLAFGEASTTAEEDIDRATDVALQMVGRYGMSPGIGWRRMLSKAEGFLGGDGPTIEAVSGQTLYEFDQEVRNVIDQGEKKAAQLLGLHRGPLEEMVNRLEAQETLEGPDLAALLSWVSPDISSGTSGGRVAPVGRP